jgi:eukaryotic-like serine/threonine-protein kinase
LLQFSVHRRQSRSCPCPKSHRVSPPPLPAATASSASSGRAVWRRSIARVLGVKAIIFGRVAQRGADLSIGVELVDVADKRQLWGQQYHRRAADLLQIQADISRDIATSLRTRLSASERARITRAETENLQAYDLLLHGRFYFEKGGTENRKAAVGYFERALSVDPGYALAHVWLARAYTYLVYLGVFSPADYMPKIDASVQKALALDDRLADAYVALASANRSRWDWAGTERALKQAIALNTNLAYAHDGYASHLSNIGRHDEAVGESRRAIELDPLSASLTTRLGLTLLFARRHDEAIEVLKGALEKDRSSSLPYLFLGYNYAAKGMTREAVKAYEEAVRLGDDSPSIRIYLGAAYAREGDRSRAQSILEQLTAGNTYVSPGEVAILYAAPGRKDEAFASLEKALARRDPQLVFLGCDPAFDPLRGDGRFKSLMQRVGLADPDIVTTGLRVDGRINTLRASPIP